MEPPDLLIRPFQPSDIDAGMRFKQFAGWNQVPEDWMGLLQLDPEGCFVGEIDGSVVGTATGLRFDERLGWIGMVLVDPDFRRRGIATRLMLHAIEYLESSPCRCLKLDATDAGAKVYEKMGFQVEYTVERWLRAGRSKNRFEESDASIRAVEFEDLARIGKWDEPIFGGDRTRLLEWYLTRCKAYWLRRAEAPEGFVFGRPGSNAFQIGPLAADTIEVAEILFRRLLAEVPGDRVIADIVTPNAAATSMLEAHGFKRFRVLQRMFRSVNKNPGIPGKVFCIAGFEFG